MGTRDPLPHDGRHDPAFEDLVRHLCERPGMYVRNGGFDAVCAYLDGFDAARDGGPLLGLWEWLVTRQRGGTNQTWVGLVTNELPADADDRQRAAALGKLLAEFFAARRTLGVSKIFQDYSRWQVRQKWYDGPLRDRKHRRR
ncbi:MAG TPA: hypothetical protein VF796_24940 [Humisphaera sp.]